MDGPAHRCVEPLCPGGVFTECHDLAEPRAKLTARAAWWAIGCARKIISALRALQAVRAVAIIARTGPKIRGVRSALAKFKNVKAVRAARDRVGDELWTPGKKFKSNPKNALHHFNKHKDDFPDCRNAKEYVEKARQFMTDPPRGYFRQGSGARG